MLDRRRVLIGAGAAGLSALLAGASFATVPTNKRFVFIVLRGGMDGLGAVAPIGDPAYAAMRRELAFANDDALGGAFGLDDVFMAHGALAPVKDLYAARDFAVVHAAATDYRARSHFDAQDALEAGGLLARDGGSGWVYRALVETFRDTRFGLSVGSQLPFAIAGATPVATFAPNRLHGAGDGFMEAAAALWAEDALLGPAIAEGLKAKLLAERQLAEGEVSSGGAADTFPEVASIAGRLLAAEDGPRICVLDMNGFDTHRKQGVGDGPLARSLSRLALGIEALAAGLGEAWGETAVVAASEFGRTVEPNGTLGTDHGTGGAAFLAGGAIAGGRVIADWPGIAKKDLFEGRDLMPTTDLRAVLKGVLADHLGVRRAALDEAVFPSSAGVAPMRGLIRR